MEIRTASRLKACVSRRSFNRTSLLSLLAAAAALPFEEQGFAGQGATQGSSTRRDVIKQRLPGEPQRQLTLVEVVYRQERALHRISMRMV
jgi:hypothetical protein